jgi:hypothetical protein
MQQPPETFFNLADFVPPLREQFDKCPLPPRGMLLAAVPIKDPKKQPTLLPAGTNRRSISISDGENFWFWEPASLEGLFRGDKEPPVLGDYPEAYNDSFIILDLQKSASSSATGGTRR